MLFLKNILSVPCTMDNSFFSQQMAPWCLNFPHQRLWAVWQWSHPATAATWMYVQCQLRLAANPQWIPGLFHAAFDRGSCQILKFVTIYLFGSDESKPSWLEPKLELKDFQLGSVCDLFPFSSKSKIGRNELKFWFWFIYFFFINHFNRIGLKIIKLCT